MEELARVARGDALNDAALQRLLACAGEPGAELAFTPARGGGAEPQLIKKFLGMKAPPLHSGAKTFV